MSEIVGKIIINYALGERRFHVERPVTISAVVPTADPAEMLSDQDDETPVAQGDIDDLNELVGLRVGIVYADSDDEESRREVNVRALRLLADGRRIGLQCWCHARKAPRLFRLDRVRTVFDPETGEAFDDFRAYLAAFTASSDRPALSAAERVTAAIAAVRADLQVLVFLARCDGWHHSELAVGCNFVLDAPTTPIDVDIAELERQVRRIDPDQWVFRRALNAFQKSSKGRLERLHRAMRRLVNADGLLSREEGEFIEEFAAALEGRPV